MTLGQVMVLGIAILDQFSRSRDSGLGISNPGIPPPLQGFRD